MQESISFRLSILLLILIPKSQQETGRPPIHCACCGEAWQISTLQKCWMSLDVCLIRTAWPFPDLANRRFWYNGTFRGLSGRDSFSSDPLSSDADVYFVVIIQFRGFSTCLAMHSIWHQMKVIRCNRMSLILHSSSCRIFLLSYTAIYSECNIWCYSLC